MRHLYRSLVRIPKSGRAAGARRGVVKNGKNKRMEGRNNSAGSTDGQQRRRAAMYVRMSTDHQKYSTENQADAIREYAAHRQIDIVKTYTDSGKSGLKLDGRDALQNLIADVQSGSKDYSVILVLDVTR